jgi:hypothetical protein
MIESSFTLVFDPSCWGFGCGFHEVDGNPGIPAITLDIQLFFFKVQVTLYRTWDMQDS